MENGIIQMAEADSVIKCVHHSKLKLPPLITTYSFWQLEIHKLFLCWKPSQWQPVERSKLNPQFLCMISISNFSEPEGQNISQCRVYKVLAWLTVSWFGLVVRCYAGKQTDLGSNPLRLSFLFKLQRLWFVNTVLQLRPSQLMRLCPSQLMKH